MADFQEEIWKDIAGFEGVYQVSNMGRVKTLEKLINCWDTPKRRKEQIVTPIIQKSGYAHVGLWRKQTCKQARVHRLVAEAFCENPMPEKKTQVNHINENKLDNRACNLEWVTPKENTNHGTGIERRVRKHAQHMIIQMDKNTGEVLRIFKNERQASLSCGHKPHGEIRKVCLGQQITAHGYKWAYASGGDLSMTQNCKTIGDGVMFERIRRITG